VADPCEPGSIEGGEIVDQLSYYQVLKKNSAPGSCVKACEVYENAFAIRNIIHLLIFPD
jgi:hypothetical protein